jgi:hypothetical protein
LVQSETPYASSVENFANWAVQLRDIDILRLAPDDSAVRFKKMLLTCMDFDQTFQNASFPKLIIVR